MKRFLASGVLVPAMLLSLLAMLGPASLALAASAKEQSQSATQAAFTTSICVRWADEKDCNTGASHRSGTHLSVTVSAQPEPVAPWRLVMMGKRTAPTQGEAEVIEDCGQKAQCRASGSVSGPATAVFWSCVTDRSTNLAEVCSKAGSHAILSDYAQVVIS